MSADGGIKAGQLRSMPDELLRRLAKVQMNPAAEGPGSVLGGLVDAAYVASAWRALPLSRKRAVLDTLLRATTLPVGRGQRFLSEQLRTT